MAQSVLLDSSVVIPHLRGKLDLITPTLGVVHLYIPLVVLGELYKGALKSSQPEKNGRLIETFLKTVAVIHPDTATALHYARISAELDAKGTPIPENDVWIAAVAMECSMPLAARDAHFQRIDGLQLLQW
jgi:tRNA(fMet)-specific endonuclease VapC